MAGLVTDELNKFGPFGRYNGVNIVTNGFKDFSSGSSDLGAAAFIVSGSTIKGRVKLARGGTIELDDFAVGSVYEIGLAAAESDNATTFVLVLQR